MGDYSSKHCVMGYCWPYNGPITVTISAMYTGMVEGQKTMDVVGVGFYALDGHALIPASSIIDLECLLDVRDTILLNVNHV